MPTEDQDSAAKAGSTRAGGITDQGYGDVLWEPDAKVVDGARITAYLRWLAAERSLSFDGYDALWRWSTARPAEFWSTVWDYFDVLGDRGPGPFLEGGPMPDVRWFRGATINYARNALRTAQTDPGRIAIIFHNEIDLAESIGPEARTPGAAGDTGTEARPAQRPRAEAPGERPANAGERPSRVTQALPHRPSASGPEAGRTADVRPGPQPGVAGGSWGAVPPGQHGAGGFWGAVSPGQHGAEGSKGARPPRGNCLTYGELSSEVARVADGLRSLGVGQGDRVAGLLPNGPEAAIALLATASIGAIWSSCSPDFGPASVIDRFAQIEPTVLIAAGGYTYGGKEFRREDVVGQIAAALPGLAAVIMVNGPEAGGAGPAGPGGTGPADPSPTGPSPAGPSGAAPADLGGARRLDWSGLGTPGAELTFAEVPFDHPLWVVYSSGTTGLPKPIVHGHGGIVLEHLKALAFHQDLGPGDTFFWYTTTGWMMWNYVVGGLLVGATVVAYDGSATYPRTDALWRITERDRVTYFGVGAPYLLACAKAGLAPGRELDLSALRGVGSTGSPLPPEGFHWVYDRVGSGLLLGSFSGGTDLCTGFVGPNPLLPVRAGVIAGRCLGAKVEAFDPAGKPVIDEVGELVVTEPMPSMPVGFWNDPGGERYRDSYYAAYPGVWRHGDWIKILPDGGCIIYGRSDATLNRGGVRMGTSEFYRVVEAFPEVSDSLVVDTGRLGSEGRLVLYVALAEGCDLDGDLTGRLRAALRSKLSPRHVPDEIHRVPGIPRTLSGKKLEVPVRKILQGTPAGQAADPDALADPSLLAYFVPGGPPGAGNDNAEGGHGNGR